MTSYGSILIGSFLSQAIWGISTLQVYIYSRNYEKDRVFLKASVLCLWILDTVDQLLILKGNFKVLILQYGRVAGLLDMQSEIMYHTWIAAIVTFYVQMYFIRRILLFGKKTMTVSIFCTIISILASWQLIGIVVYWVFAYGKPLAMITSPMIQNINLSLRACALAADVLIAVGMMWLLSRHGTPYFESTRRIFFRISFITINSGAWTALVAFTVLVLILVQPDSIENIGAEFLMCTVYFSTFMANLNTRNYVVDEGGINVVTSSMIGRGGYGTSSVRRPNAAIQLEPIEFAHRSVKSDL